MTFYNENDPFAVAWLRNLIAEGHIEAGEVDDRSIKDVQAADLVGCRRVHFFAGIGGWDYALRLAGWEGPVWTGSCPCQPFSSAGKRKGEADARHLWPEFFRLIAECRPSVVFGEQVASKDALDWLDNVFADLEGAGYACGSGDLCAAGVGADHIRQRLFWVADAGYDLQPRAGQRGRLEAGERGEPGIDTEPGGLAGGMADPQLSDARERTVSRPVQPQDGVDVAGRGETRRLADSGSGVQGAGRGRDEGSEEGPRRGWPQPSVGSGADRMGHPGGKGLAERGSIGRLQRGAVGSSAGETAVGSSDAGRTRLIPCRDGKLRRISSEPGDEPLAHGIPRKLGPEFAGLAGMEPGAIRAARSNRVGRLKGYGNAIVPQAAAEFVRAYMEAAP